jgi:transcriptional regulator with XRE-family HTH domain
VNVDPKPVLRTDPLWWEHPDLRPSLAARDVRALFRWLQRRGWSQARIASATGQSQPEVSAIMNGRTVCAYAVLRRIADGLGIPRGYLGLSHCVACPDPAGVERDGKEGDDPVFRREFIAVVAAVATGGTVEGLGRWLPDPVSSAAKAPTRIGAAEVAQVRMVTAQFRSLDSQLGGGAALDAARAFAGWAQGMLIARQSEATARALQVAVADLHLLIGWIQHDAGTPAAARRHYLQALALAKEADDSVLAVETLCDLAWINIEGRRPREAVRLARLAATDPESIYPGTLAELSVMEAYGRAQLGDEAGVRASLASATARLGEADPAAVPVNATRARHMLGAGGYAGRVARVYEELGRHAEHRRYAEVAIGHAYTALAAYDPTSRRRIVLDRIALASAQLRSGARDDGLRTARSVLTETETLRSTRALARLTDIADAARPHAGHSDADDLRTRIAALVPA